MTANFKTVSVAIDDLTAHPANVRSNSPETYDPENIAHLKASIAVLGLLQPLLVQKIDGKYGALAGGRRHAALKELAGDEGEEAFTAKTVNERLKLPLFHRLNLTHLLLCKAPSRAALT